MVLPGGTSLGHYEIIDLLGAGGMGEVYRARDTRLGRQVAVKLLPPELALDPAGMQRFRQEARAASALNHPNILTVHDIGNYEGTPFLVTELLEGQTLRQRLLASPLRQGEVLDIALQIASGLDAAHKKGIVHRDIKPGNVFLTKGGQVKILDFGLAKLLPDSPPEPHDSAATSMASTVPGQILGTMPYMSPEQVRGEPVDHRSDIFSLGVVLYEMATGRCLFARDTVADSLAAILKEELPEPVEVQPGLPPTLSRAIAHCLEKRPDERFQSARDLAFDLRTIQLDTSERSRALGVGPAAPRRPALRIAALGALVFLVAAAAYIWQRHLGATRSVHLEPQRIAVAVFENRTGDASLDPLGRMASDWIIQGLSRVEGCEVVPSISILFAQPAEGANRPMPRDPLQTLAQETGAGTIVSGTYQLAGDTLRFQARVTDAVHSRLRYALEPVCAPRGAPLEAIDALRQRVMGALTVQERASYHEVEPQRPPRYDAYREYITGFELFETDNVRALDHFVRATELDPGFVTPLYYEAYIRERLGEYARVEEILRTLGGKRQDLHPFARHWLDVMVAYAGHRYPEALQYSRAALKEAPRDPITLLWAGYMARACNRPREAVTVYRDLDVHTWPDHPLGKARAMNLCYALHMLGQYKRELQEAQVARDLYLGQLELRSSEVRAWAALNRTDEVSRIIEECLAGPPITGTAGGVMLEATAELRAHGHRQAALVVADRAVEWFQNQLEAQPEQEAWTTGHIDALRWAERWDEAYEVCQNLFAHAPQNPRLLGILGGLAARRGDRTEAVQISEELRHADPLHLYGVHTYWRACIAALLGQKDEATELLRQAFNEGVAFGVTHHREIDFEPLWEYPPFRKLLEPKG
jgi:tetratricopeptide (TPR) repeat protein